MKKARILILVFAPAVCGTTGTSASAQTNAAPADLAPTTSNTQSGPVVMPPAASAPPQGDATFQPPPSAPAVQNGPVIAPPMGNSSFQPPLTAPGVQGGPAQGISPTAGPGPKGDEIYDIRPPFFYLRSWFWLWIVLAALATAGLITLIWRWLASRGSVPPQTAYEQALANLERARELMNEDDPEPYGVAVSEAIRTYLNQRFHAASTHRTTEEFLRQMQDDAATPLAAHRDLLGAFLQACDLLKFAKYHPGLPELEQVHQRAVNFVAATKPAPVGDARQPALVPRTT